MSGIHEFMRRLLEEYKCLRGKSKDSGIRQFWDVVVITTADDNQRQAFQLQIDDKAERHELPTDLPIHVVTDPPGTRIGNGGSTLTAIEFLHETYSDAVYSKKILLIHAGGWSQRMPSASTLGKIFSALPHGEPLYQMLDLKLAMFWPLVDKMKPGVFLTCADDLLVYDLGPESESAFEFPEKGFTCFAHPSSMEIGRTHGVYVLSEPEKLDKKKHVSVVECLEVLQKPTNERMEKRGAVLDGQEQFADAIKLDKKVVYTDSSFYFGTDIMKSFLDLKKKIGAITCEIDAYGDFLQALGCRATSDYISLTGNISVMTPDLLETRMTVFKHLQGKNIHLLVMNASKFIHIGTTREYIYHMCEDAKMHQELSFSKDVFNFFTESEHLNTKKQKLEGEISGCVMHSSFPKSSSVSLRSVTEYCHFEVPISVLSNTILSNCQYLESELDAPAQVLAFPREFFLHTVPIFYEGETHFVTIFMHTFDNVKASCFVNDVRSLDFSGKSIREFCSTSGLTVKDIVPEDKVDDVSAKVSLWNLRLFPAQTSMTRSLEFALTEIQSFFDGRKMSEIQCTLKRFSMADLLKVKNITAMLKYRRQLFDSIVASKQ